MKINHNSTNYPSVPASGSGARRTRGRIDPATEHSRANKPALDNSRLTDQAKASQNPAYTKAALQTSNRANQAQQFYVPESNVKPNPGNVQRLNLNHQALKSYQEHQQMDEAQELNLAHHAILGVDTYA